MSPPLAAESTGVGEAGVDEPDVPHRLELGHHSVSAERLAVRATLLNVRADYLCGFIPFPLPLRDKAAAVASQEAP